MIRIKLKCGREVEVDGFEFGITYGGLLEGSPDESLNNSIFDRTSYPAKWGSRKVLKIRPKRIEFQNKLPDCHYSAWLGSINSINPDYDGSELVVIWFGESPNGKTFEEVIQSGIEEIDWDANAQDFEY